VDRAVSTSRSRGIVPVLPDPVQKALPRSGAMRVSYKEHDEVAPTLRSAVTSLAHERRVRQRQRRSSTSQTVRSSTPRQPSGSQRRHT
jgi:hypothetical protein